MSHAQRWLATIPSLTGHKLKVAYARVALYDDSLSELTTNLNEVCQLAEQASGVARDVLSAFVPLLIDTAHLQRVQSLRATALASALPAAGRLLRCSSTEGHLLDLPSSGGDAYVIKRADGRPVSLGERRALARRPSRASLDKLMNDPHPMVVRILLANPRITEEDVVLVAARRPAIPEVTVEIAKAWSHHGRVRLTIVLNPGSPPAVSVPLLGLLVRSELAETMSAADLPTTVRATARDLHELRPPLAEIEPPELKH
ncbi:MAG: hypothetical protein DRI90_10180 [Deltaproteobacteria bacterium]|nr:MAG: hypothetical protein DRI90_10180 [Deltaproteobacteria bacterium]